ncbi:MAG: isomerizing glutamine--fructose-6-phosphate transaminase, partial [Chloroflexi bacterium]|nr:isomerizing glutamine--fructose-6-phosphate transaminase [Chloroflexota bacterium]
DWKYDRATKDGHDFYMMKEILEAPHAIRGALAQDRHLLMEMAMGILRAKQVVFTACGTSRYAALVGRYLFSKLAGRLCEVVIGSEFDYFSDSVDKNTLVIAITQSGETADVLSGLKTAKKNGATIYSLVNTVGSSVARLSDRVLYLNCGPEIGVAATKSFMSQLTILYLLAFAMANRLDEGMAKLKEDICPKIEQVLAHNGTKARELAELTKNRNDFYYIARGINFAIATEGALKLKEVSYVHAEGMPAGELKHGTLALIDEGTPVVVICPKDYTYDETMANAAETKARGTFVIGVSEVNDPMFDAWIEIRRVEEIFYPLVTIVPLQLLAYYLAVARGEDPDRPRNLAKSVTVK